MRAHHAQPLPLTAEDIKVSVFMDELIDASSRLAVYKEKIYDSKLASEWFLPTLQQREALASAMLEGTQATLDDVFINQVIPDGKDRDLAEVDNYFKATVYGYKHLQKNKFSDEFILELHKQLMNGIRRSADEIGQYRTKQNYIANIKDSKEVTFVPPVYEDVPSLMDNLISYIVAPADTNRVLVRAAIIHAQFLTIHPFMDGNGRVGRILVPLYLYAYNQIELPCFFISETLERDKFRYYKQLNDIRQYGKWSEWIKFFLSTIIAQCDKYIDIVSKINGLYDRHLTSACALVRSSKMVDLINILYKFPVINAKKVSENAGIPPSTANRYLNILAENDILYSNGRERNRTYYYYDLLNVLR